MFLASYIGRRVWKDNYTDIEGDLMKVGLFGGTFDPPHKGHFVIGKTVKEKLDLDEVWFIPTYEPLIKMKQRHHQTTDYVCWNE